MTNSTLTVLFSLALVAQFAWYNLPEYEDKSQNYADVSAFMHPTKDACLASGNRFKYVVNVVFDDSMEPMGEWLESTKTLKLRDTDVDTIAHEVNHLVHSMLRENHITDDHMFAYAQGFWTQCVFDIVERHKVVDFINQVNHTN